MKSNKKKTKTKTHSKSRNHSKTRTTTHTTHKHTSSSSPTRTETIPTPSFTLNTTVKACQEVEVGDIGGFGSTAELEEHEKRCSEPATEFCSNCGKTLCHSHYDLIHRDHDHPSGYATSSPSGPTPI